MIDAKEQARRRHSNENVIGTSAMEGITLDAETLALMQRFEEGELTRKELSTAIDAHVAQLVSATRVPAENAVVMLDACRPRFP